MQECIARQLENDPVASDFIPEIKADQFRSMLPPTNKKIVRSIKTEKAPEAVLSKIVYLAVYRSLSKLLISF